MPCTHQTCRRYVHPHSKHPGRLAMFLVKAVIRREHEKLSVAKEKEANDAQERRLLQLREEMVLVQGRLSNCLRELRFRDLRAYNWKGSYER